jgi:alkanesulfonate monooxygenase SsuD/methylene tetrahydromethanopterin reductase-like flavin-dependent oxidoreductase (luciferase family)
LIAPSFGIFDHIEDIPGTPTSRLFNDRLALIKMADEGGLAGYHLAEHHGSELCMAPGQELFIAAASQVAKNIRLGPMVKLLPMHHPVRIIEDLCVLDQLTEGRLEFGVGRGAVPIEHYWFGREWPGSRERFVDVLGIIQRALASGEISSEGSRFYDFPRMPLATKPFQDQIPFWYPGSPMTAGRHGMSLMWPGKIDRAAYEQYVEAWQENKDDPIRLDGPGSRPRVAYSMLLAIAPTEAQATDIARRGMSGLIRRTRNAHRFDRLVLPEDECEAAQAPLRAIHANVDLAIKAGAGTPGQIAERLAGLLEEGMTDYICFMLPTGDMSLDEARRTLDLFITEVKPQLEQPARAGSRP